MPKKTLKALRAQATADFPPGCIPPPPYKQCTESILKKARMHKGNAGIRAFVDLHKLVCSPVHIEIESSVKDANTNTMRDYKYRWRELALFCYLRADYQSAALCDRNSIVCVVKPFPIKPRTLIEFFQYKLRRTNEKLTDASTGEFAVDCDGMVIYCTDTWHAPGNIRKFKSALHVLHSAYEHLRQDYVEACPECITANLFCPSTDTGTDVPRAHYSSCLLHANMPLLRTQGDTTRCQEFERAFTSAIKFVHAWKAKGAIQLLPGEVRSLRNRLCCTNDLKDLQMYCMILIGIKLYLRCDEILSMLLSDFQKDMHIVKANKIEVLTVRINGKCDSDNVYLNLYLDDDCPEFCAIRHILVYIALAGLNSPAGFLFPNVTYLMNRNLIHIGDATEEAWKYCNWHDRFRKIVVSTLDRYSEFGVLGTHTLRKTAYLFAIWGLYRALGYSLHSINIADTNPVPDSNLLQVALVMRNARHLDIRHALTYVQDCLCQLARLQRAGNLGDHKPPSYIDIVTYHVDTARTVALPFAQYQKPIYDTAIYFIQNILQITLSDKPNLLSVLETVLARPSHESPREEMVSYLKANVTDEIRMKVTGMFDSSLEDFCNSRVPASVMPSAIRECIASPVKVSTIEIATVSPSTMSTITTGTGTKRGFSIHDSQSPGTPCTKKPCVSQTAVVAVWKIPERKSYDPSLSMRDKLDVILTIHSKYADMEKSKIFNADRVFYYRTVLKVGTCYRSCHQSNLESFIRSLGNKFSPSTFHCDICSPKK